MVIKMPTLQFSIPAENVNISKNFPSPVKITDLYKGWYKTCQKLVPTIPDIPETVGWERARWTAGEPEVDEKWIKFVMVHRYSGLRAHLVINRKGPSM